MSSSEDRIAARGSPTAKGLNGWHVLGMLVAFFGIVFVVNGVFLSKALSTYTGVVSQEPYVKGLQYNSRIAAGERQQALGWSETLALSRDGALEVVLTDSGGRPVEGLVLAGIVGRPATVTNDRRVVLAESRPGHYAAVVGSLDAGTWLVSLEAKARSGGEETVYRMRRRQWLKP